MGDESVFAALRHLAVLLVFLLVILQISTLAMLYVVFDRQATRLQERRMAEIEACSPKGDRVK